MGRQQDAVLYGETRHIAGNGRHVGWVDDDTKREALGSWTWASSQKGSFMKRVVHDIQYLAKIKVNNETEHIVATTFGIPYCE
ncbi:unnamed protein product [Fusarium graminearum]|uniref:Chromosome 4, complete genome n=1 Tax=Gibberella zeae (strain ATCC MYA-4620 / CBS 123657 / FGSC 9075 / NRRL 31084 / PH-1) TaxID=229533 RepID=A0A098DSP4_GIBZE|nr:unnamed protein product [Fusarium graminearum]CZS72851.1 unnamed protein product [Fusarium graminearum]